MLTAAPSLAPVAVTAVAPATAPEAAADTVQAMSSAPAPRLDLQGGVVIDGDWWDHYGSGLPIGQPGECSAGGQDSNYPDVYEGAQVTVTNGAGAVVGVGTLSPGQLEDPILVHEAAVPGSADIPGSDIPAFDTLQGRCRYDFAVEVGSADFYMIRVGSRNPVTVSRAQAESKSVPDLVIPYIY